MNAEDVGELSPEARALLTEVRGADDPTPKDRSRNKRAVMAAIAGGAGLAASTAASSAAAASATGAASTAAGLSIGVKVAAAVLALGAIGVTATLVPEMVPDVEAPETTASDEPAPAVAEEPAPMPAPRARPAPSGGPAAPTAEEADAPAPLPAPAAEPPRPASVARARPRAAPSTAAPEPEPASTLPQEVALLRRAQRAINAERPAEALTILADHAVRFPGGVMAEEREAARVVALCRAGRAAEARAAAARFLRERPSSPLAARVRAACP